MKRYIKWLAITIFISMLSACARTAPVQQISTTVSVGHTQEQVKNAILKAGAQRKWIMTQVSLELLKLAIKHEITLLRFALHIQLLTITSNMTIA